MGSWVGRGATVLGALKDGRCAPAAPRCCASLTAPARRGRRGLSGRRASRQINLPLANKGLSKDGPGEMVPEELRDWPP